MFKIWITNLDADTGQNGSGLVPAETKLPADWQYLLNYGESSKRSPALSKDTTLTQQRGGNDPGLLEGVILSFPYPATHTKLCLFPVYIISGRKFRHLRKSSPMSHPW